MNDDEIIDEAQTMLSKLSMASEENKCMAIHFPEHRTSYCVYNHVSGNLQNDLEELWKAKVKLEDLENQMSANNSDCDLGMMSQELRYQHVKAEELYWFYRKCLIGDKAKAAKFIRYDAGTVSKEELKQCVFCDDHYKEEEASLEHQEASKRWSQASTMRNTLKEKRRNAYEGWKRQLCGVGKLNCVVDFIHNMGGMDVFLAMRTDIIQNKTCLRKEWQMAQLASWLYMADCLQEKSQLKKIFTRPLFVESDDHNVNNNNDTE